MRFHAERQYATQVSPNKRFVNSISFNFLKDLRFLRVSWKASSPTLGRASYDLSKDSNKRTNTNDL